ncbi:MAG: SPFH domain-containing protein [Leptospiraceae bacterium]|nr:SPFH domain-containing protein [Leptospiraceae bacterium]
MALIDRIKFDGGADDIVWKYPKDDITWGGQLIVNESQEAIFFKGGQALDLFGAGTHTLKSNNIPLLEKLVNLPFGGDTPFTAEVWYVAKKQFLNMKWGTKTPIQVEDPKFGILTNMRAFGIFGFRVIDTSFFVTEIVGTQKAVTTQSVHDVLRSTLISDIEELISQVIHDENIDIIRVNTQRSKIEQRFTPMLNEKFAKMGIEVVQFEIESLNIPQDDPGYMKLVEARANRAAKVEEALGDKAVIDTLGADYQRKRMLDIGEAAASNEGGGSGSMMGAGMGMGMGVNMGQMMGGMMGGMNNMGGQQQQQPAGDDPAAKLTKLKGLLDGGLISQEEFDKKKAEILANL